MEASYRVFTHSTRTTKNADRIFAYFQSSFTSRELNFGCSRQPHICRLTTNGAILVAQGTLF